MIISNNSLFAYFNIVFNELQKKQFDEITFANKNGECDFVVKKGLEYQAIQVCYKLTTENNKREFGGFATIENDVEINQKTIITYNQEMQDKNVTITPAWKYFWEDK